jgi:hypothetical protein
LIPIDRDGAAEIEGNALEGKALGIAKNQAASLEFGLSEVSVEGAGVHDEEPRGNDGIGLAKNEGEATELTIRIGSDLPGGESGGLAKTFFWGEKGVGRAQALQRAVVGNFGKRESFGAGERRESGSGENRGFKGGEGTGHLIVLGGFEDIGGVEGQEETDGVWAIGRDGAEEEGEVKTGPWPRCASEVCDGDESRQRGDLGGSRSGGKEKSRVGHGGGGEEQTESACGQEGENLRKLHHLTLAEIWEMAKGNRIEKSC